MVWIMLTKIRERGISKRREGLNSMELRDILNLALSREQASIELYTDLLETYQRSDESEKEIKDLLSFLIREQIQHKQLIVEKIGNLYSTVNPTLTVPRSAGRVVGI